MWTRRWLVAVVKEGGGRFENQMKREALGKGGVVGLVERERDARVSYLSWHRSYCSISFSSKYPIEPRMNGSQIFMTIENKHGVVVSYLVLELNPSTHHIFLSSLINISLHID